jgi:hypothetical protein
MDVGNPNSSQVIIDDLGEVIKLKVQNPQTANTLNWESNTLITKSDSFNTYYAPSMLVDYNGFVIQPLVLDIGDWNMDTGDTKQVTHQLGVKWLYIISATAWVQSDSLGLRLPLDVWNYLTDSKDGGIYTIDTTYITLKRKTGGIFDSASFSSAAINRGKVIVWLGIQGW